VIGFRDPKTGERRLNPPDDTPIPEGAQLVYLADQPRLA